MTEERLRQITHPGPLEAELLHEVRRLQSEREALKLQHSALHGFCEAALAERDALKLRVLELEQSADGWFKAAGAHENSWLACQKDLYEMTQARGALLTRVAELEQEARYWRRLAEERGALEEIPL